MQQHQRSPRNITDWLNDGITILTMLRDRAQRLADSGTPVSQGAQIARAARVSRELVRMHDPQAW